MFGVLLSLVIVLSESGFSNGADELCQRCECLPTQAICRDKESAQKIFFPATSESNKDTLELVYIYGIETVNFAENSFSTTMPVTILIQNCTNVNIFSGAIDRLRTLVIRDAKNVQLGILNYNYLWASYLENIETLVMDSRNLFANYSVNIGHVTSLTVQQNSSENICNSNYESTFNMYSCKVNPIYNGAMSLCGGHISINSNTFEFIYEEGLQVTTEGAISIMDNNFKQLQKQSFILSSPEIHITGNHFDQLPAGALRGISTIQDTFFVNNTIEDIDLGGVFLDMGWDMVIENNMIQCDCTSKRTSILNPKHDMLYLTNSSLDKLHTNFMNNFCNLNCTVSLETFSRALYQGDVCLTNNTELEPESLCNITKEANYIPDLWEMSKEEETSITPISTTRPIPSNNSFMFSSATKIEFFVPLSLIIVSLLITSSMLYGCREMITFKYKFSPNRLERPKVSQHK